LHKLFVAKKQQSRYQTAGSAEEAGARACIATRRTFAYTVVLPSPLPWSNIKQHFGIIL
jgi:hypothetical protein